MPKKITSHKNLSIRWRTDANCFQLDLEPIGERSVRTNVGKEMDKAIARALRSAK